jgi:hypothetical protein
MSSEPCSSKRGAPDSADPTNEAYMEGTETKALYRTGICLMAVPDRHNHTRHVHKPLPAAT